AIIRTGWRLLISHKRLLEWVPCSQIDKHFHNSNSVWFLKMVLGPIAAIAGMLILLIDNRFSSLVLFSPLFILWGISPLLARRLSQPISSQEIKISQADTRFLHK